MDEKDTRGKGRMNSCTEPTDTPREHHGSDISVDTIAATQHEQQVLDQKEGSPNESTAHLISEHGDFEGELLDSERTCIDDEDVPTDNADEERRESNAKDMGQEEADEEEDPEMTQEEKGEMYKSVKAGDIDLLDDLLDKRGADINMTWFNENLLMTAIRQGQQEMAEFLLDNGIDQNFESTRLDNEGNQKNPDQVKWYTISCRQMAYEADMADIVELIDVMNGDLWPFLKPRDRNPRLKKPLELKIQERLEREREEGLSDGEDIDDEDGHVEENEEQQPPLFRITETGDTDSQTSGAKQRLDDSKTGSQADKITSGSCEEERSYNDKGDEGYDTLSSISSFGSLEPTRPWDIPVTTMHRDTKSYLSRRRVNSARLRTLHEEPVLERSKTFAYGSYLSESRMWAPVTISRESQRHRNSDINIRNQSPTRMISPWKDDDPQCVQMVKVRCQSAYLLRRQPSSAPLNMPYFNRRQTKCRSEPDLQEPKLCHQQHLEPSTVPTIRIKDKLSLSPKCLSKTDDELQENLFAPKQRVLGVKKASPAGMIRTESLGHRGDVVSYKRTECLLAKRNALRNQMCGQFAQTPQLDFT